MAPLLDYTDKRVVVTGAATGVGAALLDILAENGAPDVTVLDIKPPTGPHSTFLQTDLSNRDALDAAASQISGPIDTLFNNAGVADTLPPEVVFGVNVLAPIRLTSALLPSLRQGGAVVNTASIAGMAWPKRLVEIKELLANQEWDAMVEWFEGRSLGIDPYSFTKEVVQVWTMYSARAIFERGLRINAVCPSPIDTPLLGDFRATMSEAGLDFVIQNGGGRPVTPREVAAVLAWLGSPASSFVNGQNINIDAGFQASMTTGQVDTSAVRAQAGRA